MQLFIMQEKRSRPALSQLLRKSSIFNFVYFIPIKCIQKKIKIYQYLAYVLPKKLYDRICSLFYGFFRAGFAVFLNVSWLAVVVVFHRNDLQVITAIISLLFLQCVQCYLSQNRFIFAVFFFFSRYNLTLEVSKPEHFSYLIFTVK